ncbi:NTR [Stigmatella aurantiaca DW4/3-1]|uniref:NTR n=1 Tax=Stigmatella aurantiaca (strain DW4/3-1) TaxID=378806 RepID=Q097V6_STIAD|nr:NTR [Stigmatella aurantiaca DW4/3-1]
MSKAPAPVSREGTGRGPRVARGGEGLLLGGRGLGVRLGRRRRSWRRARRTRRGAALGDLQQFHLEHERRATRDVRRGAAVAVGQVGRAHEAGLAAHLHLLHALRPAADDAVEREGRRLAPLVGAVELLAVGERALVVHLDDVRGLRGLARARLRLLVDEARLGLRRALFLGGLLQEGLALLLLTGRLGRLARHGELLNLRPEGLDVHHGLVALHLGGEAGLDEGQLLRGEVEHAHAPADGQAQRVQRLLIVGLRVGPRARTRGRGRGLRALGLLLLATRHNQRQGRHCPHLPHIFDSPCLASSAAFPPPPGATYYRTGADSRFPSNSLRSNHSHGRERLTAAAGRNQLGKPQEHHRAEDGADEARGRGGTPIAPPDECGEKASHEGASHSQQRGADEAHLLFARHDGPGEQPHNEAEDDPATQPHGDSSRAWGAPPRQRGAVCPSRSTMGAGSATSLHPCGDHPTLWCAHGERAPREGIVVLDELLFVLAAIHQRPQVPAPFGKPLGTGRGHRDALPRRQQGHLRLAREPVRGLNEGIGRHVEGHPGGAPGGLGALVAHRHASSKGAVGQCVRGALDRGEDQVRSSAQAHPVAGPRVVGFQQLAHRIQTVRPRADVPRAIRHLRPPHAGHGGTDPCFQHGHLGAGQQRGRGGERRAGRQREGQRGDGTGRRTLVAHRGGGPQGQGGLPASERTHGGDHEVRPGAHGDVGAHPGVVGLHEFRHGFGAVHPGGHEIGPRGEAHRPLEFHGGALARLQGHADSFSHLEVRRGEPRILGEERLHLGRALRGAVVAHGGGEARGALEAGGASHAGDDEVWAGAHGHAIAEEEVVALLQLVHGLGGLHPRGHGVGAFGQGHRHRGNPQHLALALGQRCRRGTAHPEAGLGGCGFREKGDIHVGRSADGARVAHRDLRQEGSGGQEAVRCLHLGEEEVRPHTEGHGQTGPRVVRLGQFLDRILRIDEGPHIPASLGNHRLSGHGHVQRGALVRVQQPCLRGANAQVRGGEVHVHREQQVNGGTGTANPLVARGDGGPEGTARQRAGGATDRGHPQVRRLR